MANHLGSGWNHIDHPQRSVGDVPSHSSFWDDPGYSQFADPPAGAGFGGLADRQRVQSVGGFFRGCKNLDERAFERCIDLHCRGEGGQKILPMTIPALLHVNARGIDLIKRTQHIERRKPKC